MFTTKQPQKSVEYYNKLLKILGSLSNLFSDSTTPYLNYRISENLYCKAFHANNLSRSDVSADASKDRVGIGIKTFVGGNGNTWQKVAEFNKLRSLYIDIKNTKEQIKTISGFRNERIGFTKRNHNLDTLIYHCIVRNEGLIKYYDTDFPLIDIKNITDVAKTKNIITFNDSLREYSFNLSKSTLYERFLTPESSVEIPIEIITDPFEALETFLGASLQKIAKERRDEKPYVLLPLYSIKHGEKSVFSKSGLNNWNAAGRQRDINEIYIQHPAEVRSKFPNFFPQIDEPFELQLPNGNSLVAKVCQEKGKAIMSNPNKELGQWLLRDVLKLEEGQLLTYEMLEKIGVDSVLITKEDTGKYSINFAKLGRYESFLKNLPNSFSFES